MWWRFIVLALTVVLLRVAIGGPLDRAFFGGMIGGAVALGLIFMLLPLLDKWCEAEDRMWHSLWLRLRRSR
jgi:hypothetical protein